MKKVISLYLAFILIFATGITAFAADTSNSGGTIGFSGDLVEVTYKVAIPLSMEFSIDPIELKEGGQIYCGTANYNIINKTLAPVMVTLDLTAKASSGVKLVADKGKIDRSGLQPTGKDLYLGIQPAKSVALGSSGLTTTATPADVDGTYDVEADAVIVPFDIDAVQTDEANISFAFVLAKATPGTDVPSEGASDAFASGVDGAAGFRIFGALTTYAGWQESDLTISGTYDLTALRPDDYAAAEMADANAHRLLKAPPAPAVPGLIGNAKGTSAGNPMTIDRTGGPAEVLLLDNNETVTGVTWTKYNNAAPVAVASTGYTTSTEGVVSLKIADTTYSHSSYVSGTTDTTTIVITTSVTSYTIHVKVTNY